MKQSNILFFLMLAFTIISCNKEEAETTTSTSCELKDWEGTYAKVSLSGDCDSITSDDTFDVKAFDDTISFLGQSATPVGCNLNKEVSLGTLTIVLSAKLDGDTITASIKETLNGSTTECNAVYKRQ